MLYSKLSIVLAVFLLIWSAEEASGSQMKKCLDEKNQECWEYIISKESEVLHRRPRSVSKNDEGGTGGDGGQTGNENTDIVVKIANKAWFIAKLSLAYKLQNSEVINFATGTVWPLQEYVLYMPFNANLTAAYLDVDALLGPRVMTSQIRQNPECFHIWGGSFAPKWTYIECW